MERACSGKYPLVARRTAVEARPLSWRSDPETSLWDWLIITVAGGDRAEFYSHQAILGVGPRKSDYFAQLFTGRAGVALAEGNTRTSTLQLERTAFDAFPAFLDYMYEGKLSISDESAVALRYLADYLLCNALFNECGQFIGASIEYRGDLADIEDYFAAGDAIAVFLEQAHLYHLEDVGDACVTACAERFFSIDPTCWTRLEPSLYLRVVQAVLVPDGRLCDLSEYICAYCDDHAVDLALLTQLTASLTSVSHFSALGLLGHSLACGGPAALKDVCTARLGLTGRPRSFLGYRWLTKNAAGRPHSLLGGIRLPTQVARPNVPSPSAAART